MSELYEPWYRKENKIIQCHKCVTQLLDVTDQAHTHPLGLQVPTHSQLVNNHTVQAAVEVLHHGKNTEGGSLRHCFPAPCHLAMRQHGPEKSKDTSRERYLPTENNLCFGDTPVVSLMGLKMLVRCQALANECQKAQHHRDP